MGYYPAGYCRYAGFRKGGCGVDLRRVDLNLLVVLDVLLSECNVTRAAERLNMSQPATSTALARLRKQFDDPLLAKNGRTLRLTPRAQALIGPLRSVLHTLERSILSEPTFDPTVDSRVFTLMTGDYAEVTLLRMLMRRGHPANVRFDLRPLTKASLAAFHRHETDLAVLPEHLLDAPEFERCRRTEVLTDRYVGAVWSGHPYIGTELNRDVLSHYPFLSYLQYDDDTALARALLRAGIVTRTGASTTSIAVLPFALEHTVFVTLLPERMAERIAGVASLRILEPAFELPPLSEYAVWHEESESDPAHVWLRAQIDASQRLRVPAGQPA